MRIIKVWLSVFLFIWGIFIYTDEIVSRNVLSHSTLVLSDRKSFRPFGFVIQMYLSADLKSAITGFRIANPKGRE